MTALVTCGHTRAGLAAVRALGRGRCAVAVAGPARPALALWSRYATSTLLVPDAASEARCFAGVVADEAAGRRCHVILTATDSALWALSRWRDQLPEGARRVMPPHDAVARSLDRTALRDRARALGIPCSDVLRVEGAEGIEPALRKLARLGQMPVIVRPLVPWVEREDGSRRLAESIPVQSLAEVRRLLYAREELARAGCLLEPRPEGQWLAYGAVCDDGRVLCEIFQERLRERGDLSGVSTLARTFAPDEEMRILSCALLESLSWQGPALVEMFRGHDGVLRLVNVIGRLWGSLQLSINAGINVPMLCEALARGEGHPRVVAVAEAGHVWRWLVGDLEVMAKRAGGLVRRLEGAGVFRRRMAAVRQLLNPDHLLHARSDVFDLDDPLPFVLELARR